MRIAWRFDGYNWPINPNEDSGWDFDHVVAEGVPIRASKSTIQFGGMKSARRRVSGFIWGINGPQLLAKLNTWNKNLTRSTLTDHTGMSRSAVLVKFTPKPVSDISEWRAGRQTYRYDAEFLALD